MSPAEPSPLNVFKGSIGETIADCRPWWSPTNRVTKPNVLVVLFDDLGFSDFGCYDSLIRTPTIDALAQRRLRYTGFHTTAMCSTTRAALMTGCNHHKVGMGCLPNFDIWSIFWAAAGNWTTPSSWLHRTRAQAKNAGQWVLSTQWGRTTIRPSRRPKIQPPGRHGWARHAFQLSLRSGAGGQRVRVDRGSPVSHYEAQATAEIARQ